MGSSCSKAGYPCPSSSLNDCEKFLLLLKLQSWLVKILNTCRPYVMCLSLSCCMFFYVLLPWAECNVVSRADSNKLVWARRRGEEPHKSHEHWERMKGSKTAKLNAEFMLLLRIGFKKVALFSSKDFDNHEKDMTKRRRDSSWKSLNLDGVLSALKAWRCYIYVYI